MASRITGKIGETVLKELQENHGDIVSAVKARRPLALFSLEANVDAGEIIDGTTHVRIHNLRRKIFEYPGNCYVRPLYEAIPTYQTRSFLEDFLGRSYEGKLTELFRAL